HLAPIASATAQPDGEFVVLHVQPPPNIAAGLNPAPIPFGGPSGLEVPAFTQAILEHALEICSEKNVEVKTEVTVGDPKEKICEVSANRNGDLLVMGCRAIGPLKRNFVGMPIITDIDAGT
ncbi:uncharacterized protein LOC112898387, partial [Panicum hallii]|uniref:uncharacterized protein LOC112898387 n=1 Tax=Panicum hallii TaxID=206008 RepID=UPI000DF4CDE0